MVIPFSSACVPVAVIFSQCGVGAVSEAAGAQSAGSDIHIAQAESGVGARLARLRHNIEMKMRRRISLNTSKPKSTTPSYQVPY